MRCVHHAIPQPTICEVCARELGASRRRRRGVAVALLVVAPLAAGVVYLQTRPKAAPPPPREADNVLRLQEDALKLHPCDATMLSERVERFVTLNRLPEALATARRAVGCGVGGRMPWRVAYLEQQLHQWLPTVVTTTELILAEPWDSDFWWWRADAWMDGKLPRLAMFDLRQSLANSTDAQAGGFAAVRMLDAAKATGEMCEADRAWRFFVHELGGSPNQDMRDEHAALVRDKTCEDTSGSGTLSLTAKVTINGTIGTFKIDRGAGTTLVSRMFAAKAGIVSDPKVLGLAPGAGQPMLGEAVRLDKMTAGSVSAGGVDALVVDNLDSDGVIGLSFLWHFSIAETAQGLHLTPLDRNPL
jgi:hypothetical protein